MDVTYVGYSEQQWRWGYLSVALDLCDHSVVSWVYLKRQDLDLVLTTLMLTDPTKSVACWSLT